MLKIVPHFAALFCMLAALPALAGAEPFALPSAPALAAKAYALYDYTSNQVLVAQNAHARLPPATLTKMMTAYVLLSAVRSGNLQLSRQAYPSLAALHPQGDEGTMYLDHNKPVTVKELLHGMIAVSGDDAIRVLVDILSGSEPAFVERMNQHAQALGMRDSHFTNVNGRPDPLHYSSAFDLTLLAAALLREFPEYYALYAQREFQHNGIQIYSNNRLLWHDPFVDGLKAGYNPAAGYCLAASAARNSRRLVSVVLGTSSENQRDGETQRLLNYGFQNYETVSIFDMNQPVSSLRVWKGSQRAINIGFPYGLFVTVPRNSYPQFTATMESNQPVIAPVKKGQQLAVLKLSLNGQPYAEFPMQALDAVPSSNLFARGWDALRLLFRSDTQP